MERVVYLGNYEIASCSKDKTIKIWMYNTGELISTLEGHSDWVWSMQVMSNGNLITTSKDKT